ncbi:MAG: ion transporter [Alphaproteobacteria bacterium]
MAVSQSTDRDNRPTNSRSVRHRVIEALDAPQSLPARIVVYSLLAFIYGSVVLLVIEHRFPDIASRYTDVLDGASRFILAVFALELVVRLSCYPKPLRYLFSWWGLIDVVAVVPGLVGWVAPFGADLSALRALRLFRFVRILKLMRVSGASARTAGGISRKILPYVAIGVGIKGLVVALEGKAWWPPLGSDLTIVIGVTGFAIGILLGTKLGIVQRRIHALEDAIAHIAGSLRDINKDSPAVVREIESWTASFRQALQNGVADHLNQMRQRSDHLEQVLEKAGIGGPVTASLHRDIEFVLHRAQSHTPIAYERFLRNVTVVYTGVVILAIPGLVGFFSAALVIYVLGGMYVLIEDMDDPLNRDADSLIKVDLAPINF